MSEFVFLSSVVGTIGLIANSVRDLRVIGQAGRQAWALADGVMDCFRNKVPAEQQQSVMRNELQTITSISGSELERKASEIVEQELADKPPEYRKAVTEYVKLIPARITATFSRAEDRSGKTVPVQWTMQRSEDLISFLPPRPPMFQEGDSPPEASRWTLIERVGMGGFGEVWKAQNKFMSNTFNVFKFCLDPASQARMLEHEMAVIEQVIDELVDHPNIVRLMDAHLEGETPWLRYEYIPGGELSQLVATWPNDLAVRTRHAIDVMKTLVGTASDCHSLAKPIVHRDFKPSNVLIGKDGKLKVTDFGISDTLARQALDEARVATVSGMTCSTPSMVRWANTPMYASPQQKDGALAHPSDDVHALGVIFYQMIFGNFDLPLGVDYAEDLADQHVCQALLELLSHSVAARVERRYQNAGEMLEALNRLPKELVVEPVILTPTDKRQQDFALIDSYVPDAKTKNEKAAQLLEKREWAEAVSTLETIIHPALRDEKLYTRAVAHHSGKRFTDALGSEFVLVPKGTFWMGGGDGTCGDKEVTIAEDFLIGVVPVTQELWKKVMGKNPSYFQRGGEGKDKLVGVSDKEILQFPVESVSWDDCQEFIGKLNSQYGRPGWRYDLPTEAQWEYACRAAATTQEECSWSYYFVEPTNSIQVENTNFCEWLKRPSQVGVFEPNALGIYDMHGNVWEWCLDANGMYRVNCGGGWKSSAESCRAANRENNGSNLRFCGLGLRLIHAPILG